MSYKEKIARRAAREVRPGNVINLGIGIPTFIMQYLPEGFPVTVISENGVIGMGAPAKRGHEDRNLIDAGGRYVTIEAGGAFVDHALSFSAIRGGRLDVAFLGTLEVAANGDLANWTIPGKYSPGIGGAMELAQKARRVVVMTAHTNKSGKPKILEKCQLPLTAAGQVSMIITELAVMEVSTTGLVLKEIAEGTSPDELQRCTAAKLHIPPGPIPRF
jgi:3-oxoacid CoA-transferase subunit B